MKKKDGWSEFENLLRAPVSSCETVAASFRHGQMCKRGRQDLKDFEIFRISVGYLARAFELLAAGDDCLVLP
jgi:hypothetical protein